MRKIFTLLGILLCSVSSAFAAEGTINAANSTATGSSSAPKNVVEQPGVGRLLKNKTGSSTWTVESNGQLKTGSSMFVVQPYHDITAIKIAGHGGGSDRTLKTVEVCTTEVPADGNYSQITTTTEGKVGKSENDIITIIPNKTIEKNSYIALTFSGNVTFSYVTLVYANEIGHEYSFYWEPESITLSCGDEFEAPKFNNPEELPVSFKSDNTALANVDASGNITLVEEKVGTAKITATVTYEGAPVELSTTITVNQKQETTNKWEDYDEVTLPNIKHMTLITESTPVAAGSTLLNDNNLSVQTVYATTLVPGNGGEYLGFNFPSSMNIRVNDDPSKDNINGTKTEGSTSLIIKPTADIQFYAFARRQEGASRSVVDEETETYKHTTVYHGMGGPNDGKGMKIYNVTDPSKISVLDQEIYWGKPYRDYDYLFYAVKVELKAGETYTLAARGTTLNLNGFGYILDVAPISWSDERTVINLGETFTAPTIENEEGLELTFQSDNEDLAKVSDAGVISLVEGVAGTAVISAIYSGDTYPATTVRTVVNVKAEKAAHTYDFTNWLNSTKANLLADNKEGSKKGWSDIEKADGTAPTETSKENCFWLASTSNGEVDGDGNLTANGVVIKDLKGLDFSVYESSRSLAIAVNYPEALSTYEGGAYLWLGGNKKNYFVMHDVKAGSLISMGVESHKTSEPRGVKLYVYNNGVQGDELLGADGMEVTDPSTYEVKEWAVPAAEGTFDILVYNTNGCHLYFIDAEMESLEEEAAPEAPEHIYTPVEDNMIKDGIKVSVNEDHHLYYSFKVVTVGADEAAGASLEDEGFTKAEENHPHVLAFETTDGVSTYTFNSEKLIEAALKPTTEGTDNNVEDLKLANNQQLVLTVKAVNPKTNQVSEATTIATDAEGNTSGIVEIVVDSNNAPVEFYNLQGVRVDNPANGIFIRRQGNNVSKVVIR